MFRAPTNTENGPQKQAYDIVKGDYHDNYYDATYVKKIKSHGKRTATQTNVHDNMYFENGVLAMEEGGLTLEPIFVLQNGELGDETRLPVPAANLTHVQASSISLKDSLKTSQTIFVSSDETRTVKLLHRSSVEARPTES